ncbi:hypothetical protein [Pseudomonas sp. W15Feb34]|uniref:hypothetical protein n=1 Tax=Pseudomonas sp. W15Feb34 TaxID=550727 RepID=UPI002002BC92|nr:hypothetical protein [Pseudomonas sp. W15Feb34]MCK3844444.1 hypothetical protein [Pseudomonas sp. W15Feb34]
MSVKTKQIIPMPYFFIALTLIPVYLIVLLLPAQADTSTYIELNNFLDTYLLGQVGFWSSNFPLSSKVVTNYIGIFGPFFAFVFFIKVYKGLVMDPDQYKNHTFFKYFFSALVMIGLVLFLIYINYIGSVDLGSHTRKWRFFGSNVFTYALFSSGMLLSLYGMTLFCYSGFFYLPRILVKRWRNNKD